MSDLAGVSLSNHPSTIQSLPTHKPSHCCESRVCGRSWSLADYIFFAGEGFGIGGSAVAYATHAYLWASGGAFLTSVALFGHCLWRRSKGLLAINEINASLRAVDDQLEMTEKKTEEVARRLQTGNRELGKTIAEITGAAAEIHSTDLQLQKNNLLLERENLALVKTKEEIEEVNRKLTTQVEELQDALNKVNIYLKTFNQNNVLFQQTITNTESSMHLLGEIKGKIAVGVGDLETHLDRDLTALTGLIKDTHSTFKEIMTLTSNQQQRLQRDISTLTICVDEFKQLDKGLDTKKEQLLQMTAEEQAMSGQVTRLQQQGQLLRDEVKKLSKTHEVWAQVENHFHTDITNLGVTEQGFGATATRLESLQKKLEKTLIDLQFVNGVI